MSVTILVRRYVNEAWPCAGLVLAFIQHDLLPYWQIHNAPLLIIPLLLVFWEESGRILAGYLLGHAFFAGHLLSVVIGSIMTAQLVSKYCYNVDLHTFGSGSLGFVNFARTQAHWWMVMLVLVLEMGKGALVAAYHGSGLWCIMGHAFPCWACDGRGGRGLAPYTGFILYQVYQSYAEGMSMLFVKGLLAVWATLAAITLVYVFFTGKKQVLKQSAVVASLVSIHLGTLLVNPTLSHLLCVCVVALFYREELSIRRLFSSSF